MIVQITFQNKALQVDLNQAIDISIPINKDNNVNCYHLDNPSFSYFENEFFSGNLAKGGSVNCEKISFYPHASGTHTECALHVAQVDFDMRHVQIPALQMAQVISVKPLEINNDKVISEDCLKDIQIHSDIDVLLIRTQPNPQEKLNKNYSDTNPPYFEPAFSNYLKTLGIKHIITDLPSIDKESDNGALAAHKNWFLDGGEAKVKRTITELVFIPSDLSDNLYAINMQVPAIQTDAVPSRILLHPIL
jgi:kynurenine formamidase